MGIFLWFLAGKQVHDDGWRSRESKRESSKRNRRHSAKVHLNRLRNMHPIDRVRGAIGVLNRSICRELIGGSQSIEVHPIDWLQRRRVLFSSATPLFGDLFKGWLQLVSARLFIPENIRAARVRLEYVFEDCKALFGRVWSSSFPFLLVYWSCLSRLRTKIEQTIIIHSWGVEKSIRSNLAVQQESEVEGFRFGLQICVLVFAYFGKICVGTVMISFGHIFTIEITRVVTHVFVGLIDMCFGIQI